MRLPWTRDEIILAANLFVQSERDLPSSDSRVIELSELLRSAKIHPREFRDHNFRSPGSVHRKLVNIGTSDPDYKGARTRGNRLDGSVLSEFYERPEEMSDLATAIRVAIVAGVEPANDDEMDTSDAAEGRLLLRLIRTVERDRPLRERKLRTVEAAGRPTACEVCDFDFGKSYGRRGERFIEVHHVRPLSVVGPSRTSLADLSLLCSNCHRMIHRSPLLLPDELRQHLTQ